VRCLIFWFPRTVRFPLCGLFINSHLLVVWTAQMFPRALRLPAFVLISPPLDFK